MYVKFYENVMKKYESLENIRALLALKKAIPHLINVKYVSRKKLTCN